MGIPYTVKDAEGASIEEIKFAQLLEEDNSLKKRGKEEEVRIGIIESHRLNLVGMVLFLCNHFV
jgi:hypothetical protein